MEMGSKRADAAVAMSEVVPGVDRARAWFLLAAAVSFALSVGLFFTGNREQGIFVGIWVPSVLSAGSLLMGGRRDA